MTVLIADNDRAVSGLLGEVLKQAGLEPRFAYDGEEAARMARDPAVKVLVCDLDMPAMTGAEVLESLQDLAEPPAAMVVSGFLDAGVELRLRRLPFVRELLRKPFDLLAFTATVRRLLNAAEPAAGRGDADGGADGGTDGGGGGDGGADAAAAEA